MRVGGADYRPIMAETRTHACVFFVDGDWPEPVCACGQRALYLLDEGADAILVMLDDAAATPVDLTGRCPADLAVSA